MNKPNKNRAKMNAAHLGADKTRILNLGGGFAGVAAARYLDRTVAKRSDVEVTLVSKENFSLFTPMLHEEVASDLESADIYNPLRKLLRRVTVLSGEFETIDLVARRVTISYDIRGLRRALPFDYLVLALGSETNYVGIPEGTSSSNCLAQPERGSKLRSAMPIRSAFGSASSQGCHPRPTRAKRAVGQPQVAAILRHQLVPADELTDLSRKAKLKALTDYNKAVSELQRALSTTLTNNNASIASR